MISRALSVLRGLCIIASVGGAIAATRMTRDRIPTAPAEPRPSKAATPPSTSWSSIELRVSQANPFRPDHRTPPQRYSLEIANAPPPPEPPPPPPPPSRPEWSLTGILWGTSPVAVFEGVPGIEGAKLAIMGDSVGPHRIEVITPDSVVVVQGDSAWAFHLGTPWQGETR